MLLDLFWQIICITYRRTSHVQKGKVMKSSDIKRLPKIDMTDEPLSRHIPEQTSNTVENPEDAQKLYDSLQNKKQLFKLLELQGYMKPKENKVIEAEIERALADLENIINLDS